MAQATQPFPEFPSRLVQKRPLTHTSTLLRGHAAPLMPLHFLHVIIHFVLKVLTLYHTDINVDNIVIFIIDTAIFLIYFILYYYYLGSNVIDIKLKLGTKTGHWR